MAHLEALKSADLFQSLSADQLLSIAQLGHEKSFQRGEEIFKKGERARSLYILLEGFVAVRVKDEDECDLMGSTFKEEGSVLGTAALVEPHIYNVTAEALRRTITLVIEAPQLEEIMSRNANIGFKVMTRLAHGYFKSLNTQRTGMINLFKVFRSQVHKSEVYDTYREIA